MSLADKVAAIFEGPRVARIHFRLGRLEVSPQRLRGVGKAIKKGDIKVEVSKTGKLLSAAYHPHSDTLTLPDDKLATTSSQAAVLHEGIHALVDMYKCKEVTVLNDEAAAYLAEAIYLRAAHSWINGGAAEMAIYDAADKVSKAHDLYGKRDVGRAQPGHHQIAPLDMRVRRVRAQARAAGIPAEVVQLVARGDLGPAA